jgi:hypothetical protein
LGTGNLFRYVAWEIVQTASGQFNARTEYS